MSLEIDFESKEGYIHATVEGTFKKEDPIVTVFNPEKDDFLFTFYNDEAMDRLNSR